MGGDSFGYLKPSTDPKSSEKIAEPPPAQSVPSLVILVPGINAAAEDFDPLEAEMRDRGYRVARFDYDSTQSLERSADQFIEMARDLQAKSGLQKIVVIAHSMGGLVARRAMVQGRKATLAGSFPIELITVAAPFGGFASADKIPIPWNIFGIKESHRYLGTSTDFIRSPGSLGPNISHMKIETDERGRTRILAGETVADSVAFPENQQNAEVDSDPQVVRRKTIKVGHVAVLCDRGRVPDELLSVLDDWTPPLRRESSSAKP